LFEANLILPEFLGTIAVTGIATTILLTKSTKSGYCEINAAGGCVDLMQARYISWTILLISRQDILPDSPPTSFYLFYEIEILCKNEFHLVLIWCQYPLCISNPRLSSRCERLIFTRRSVFLFRERKAVKISRCERYYV
jgi:hypothetical protein